MAFDAYYNALSKLNYGKRLPGAIYIYRPNYDDISKSLYQEISRAEFAAKPEECWNLLKLHTKDYSITFLSYPEFESDPHPALCHATKINLNSGRIVKTDYSRRANPPILHRKESFLHESDPRVEKYSQLTKAEEEAGLYRDTSRIGNRLYWKSLVRKLGLTYEGHALVYVLKRESNVGSIQRANVHVDRHRTAIKRYDASKPIKLLIKHGLLITGRSFFDYGCGHGMDIEALESLGYDAVGGWDPFFRPNAPQNSAQVVNLGYVLNVIEDPTEREEALRQAFALCEEVLIVSTLAAGQETEAHQESFRDGFLTKSGTFQKFYIPGELEDLIEKCLNREAVTLSLGICLVFRSEKLREQFLSSKNRRHVDWTKLSAQLRFSQPSSREETIASRYELNQELYDDYWQCLLELGRLPVPGEYARELEISKACGGAKRALRTVIDFHGASLFDEAQRVRREDVLAYLAMKRFQKKFRKRDIPPRILQDIKTFWGDWKDAMRDAEALLFASGDPDEILLAVEQLDFGWLDRNDWQFSIHRSLFDQLPAILRIYIMCGLIRFGDLDEIDLIKIHIRSSKLTLQRYDSFESEPVPELLLRVKIDLRRFFVTVYNQADVQSRQGLYFKERFVDQGFAFKNNAIGFSKRLIKMGFTPETIGHGPSLDEFEALCQGAGLTRHLLPKR